MTDRVPAEALPPPRFIPTLEGLRAVAALLVLLTHLGSASGAVHVPLIGTFLARGTWGVSLFFVLSGFLLTRPWVATRSHDTQSPSLRRYTVLRCARIWPAYWLALAAVLVTTASGASPAAVASNATLTQIYTGHMLTGFFQTWSLCTELSFYLVLPLLAPLLIRRSTRASLLGLAALAAITPVWLWLIDALDLIGFTRVWLPGHLDWFAAGMACAVLERRLRADRPSTSWPAPPILFGAAFLVCFALMMTPLGGPIGMTEAPLWITMTSEFLFGAAAFALMGLLLTAENGRPWFARALASGVMLWAGRISYGIFLWQLLMIHLVRDALGLQFGGGGFLITAVLAGAGTVLAAQVSWTLLEQPILARAHRFGRREPQGAATSGERIMR